MDEDSSEDSVSSSEDLEIDEDAFIPRKKTIVPPKTTEKKIEILKIGSVPQKIILSSKIVLSEETKSKLEELKKELKIKEDESIKHLESLEKNKAEIKTVELTKETKSVDTKETVEDKTETKPVKDNNDDSEEESELEDDCSSPKQKKAKTTPEASEYDPKNVHYEGEVAIYTDPKSGYQYKWCNETNQWLAKTDITYGFEDDVHTYTDAEGVKYFWDVDKNAWFPKIDDEFMARYQMSYGFIDNTTKDDTKKEEEKKVKEKPETEESEEKIEKEKGLKRKLEPTVALPSWFEMADQNNTKVYVSNLPTDITEEEFVDLMQKCGLVMRDLQTQKMKVKLYTVPDTDILKGDGLCTYIKIESVELALNLLDGYVYRGKKLNVERAKFEMKGTYNPNLKPKKRRRKDKDKLKKMQEKLFDWRPEKMRGERSKHERVVIVKNLFEPTLFDREVHLILEYQQDLREECGKCGDVRRVVLYDRHPEGVAQISMKAPEEADEVVTLLNGRWFGKRQLTAEIWDGKTKYKIGETDAQISQRIDNWEEFLETEEATKPAKPVEKPTEASETLEKSTEVSKTVEKPTKASRPVENPTEASKSVEKLTEVSKTIEKPTEDSKPVENTIEVSKKIEKPTEESKPVETSAEVSKRSEQEKTEQS